jgi:glycosyltransferase involved in cell wall biosynthesis
LSAWPEPEATVPRVQYWVLNYRPEWEAVSKEIASLRSGLADGIEGSLVSFNTTDREFRLRGPEKRIPLPHGLPLAPLLGAHLARADVHHLFASAGERWLTPILARANGVLTVAKGASLLRIERNAAALRRYRAIVVQSEWDGDLMRQLGVRATSLRVIRPGVPLAQYRETDGPFTLLFASSPPNPEYFLTRGIYLMVRVAARLPDMRFLLVWRRRLVEQVHRLIAEMGVKNIEVLDGVVSDMTAVFDRAHATILPALEPRSFIPCPRSGLDSLAHGKPLLLSQFVSMARSVADGGAGVAFEPTICGMEAAIRRLRADYSSFQERAQPYLRERFSPAAHLELHRRLYQAVAG